MKYLLSKKLTKSSLGNYVLFGNVLLMLLLFSFNGAVAQTSTSQHPVLKFAIQQASQKYYNQAISTIDNYLSGKPNEVADAYYWKAYCFFKLENFKAAEENYRLTLKANSKYLPAYEDMGAMYMNQKNYEAAIPFFSSAISISDTNTLLLNSRGMCYYYTDKFELAIKDFNSVIKLDSMNYMAYNNKGSAEYNNQDIAKPHISDLLLAESDFNKALEINPDFQLAYRNRGIVRFYMNNLDLAYKDLLYSTQLDPKDENAHYFLGKLLYKQKNYPIAIQFYDNAIRLANYKSEYYLDRGICKMDMESFSSARADFMKGLLLTNNGGVFQYHIARSYAAQENMKEAMYALREGKKIGLFKETKYFSFINKDKYFEKFYKEKAWQDLIDELKFGKR